MIVDLGKIFIIIFSCLFLDDIGRKGITICRN